MTHYNLDACNILLALRRTRRISWRAHGLGTVIASFANKDTGEAWPSRATLEQMTGIESRDIPRVTRELVEAGFITIQERDGHSNIYRLTYGEIAACGDLAAVGKQPPTCGDLAAKGMGKQPPITMKEQYMNNEGTQSPANVKNRTAPQKPRVTFKDGTFGIPDAARAAWETAYPQTDLDGEIAKAAAWLVVNGGSKKDYGRFLTNWLARSERWRLEREGPPVEEYTEEQLADQRRRGEEMMAEEMRRHELGIPDWEACPI